MQAVDVHTPAIAELNLHLDICVRGAGHFCIVVDEFCDSPLIIRILALVSHADISVETNSHCGKERSFPRTIFSTNQDDILLICYRGIKACFSLIGTEVV